MSPYCCANCGFWQRYFDVPPSCPVCLDYRHPLPPEGWRFWTSEEVDERVETTWAEVQRGLVQFANKPDVGIGPRGYLIVREGGNVAFEGASWYSEGALEEIERLGGVRFLSASHPHVYGGLWQIVERFEPEVVVHQDDLPFAQAFKVSWPFADEAALAPDVRLLHTGGHTPGHTVLFLPERKTLFCGDALKYQLETHPVGRATHVSTHKAYDAHIPLSHADVRAYQAVMAPLDFQTTVTPWEVVPEGGKAAALSLFEAQLAGRPFADWHPIPKSPDATDVSMNGTRPDPQTSDPESIARYRRAAGSEEPIYEFPITPLDYTDVPVWVVGQWQADGELLTGVGYGGTDERARIGAWGEMVEQIADHEALQRLPRRTSSYTDLKAEGAPAIDPLRLRLPVTTDYAPERELQWVEARRYSLDVQTEEHERVWVPVEAVAAHFFDLGENGPDDPLFTPVTNGLGAGDSLERALSHGLLELVQRDGNSAAYRALDRGIALDLDTVSDPDLQALLRRFDERGIDLLVKLAADDFGMVNLYVVGRERDPSAAPHPLMLTGCGEAAHPDREVALGKALREYAASRVRKRFTHGPLEPVLPLLPGGYRERIFEEPAAVEESASLDAMREWVVLSADETLRRIEGSILRVDERVPFSSLPTVPPGSLASPPDVLRAVARRILDEGLEIFYVDLTSEGAPARAVKAIVPGMEVETMTYWRIGPRNLRRLLDRIAAADPVVPSDLVGLGEPPPGAYRVPMTEADEAVFGSPAWFNVKRAEEVLSDLYAMYREPDFHIVALTEGEGMGEWGKGGRGDLGKEERKNGGKEEGAASRV